MNTWPQLPIDAFVSGRTAIEEDVNAGRAVFVLRSNDMPIGEPIDIEIPQYAYQLDQESGQRIACILIQAEAAGNQLLAGVRYLDGQIGAAFLSEFELLGKITPTDL